MRNAVTEAGMDYESAESQFVPATRIEVDLEGARRVMRLVDALEDLDDVQNVYSNANVSAEVMAELEAE